MAQTITESSEQINALITEFVTNDAIFAAKGNKAAAARARKALGDIKKLVTEYRALSVEATK